MVGDGDAARDIIKRFGTGCDWKDAVIMWWGGLRGSVGLALALALSLGFGLLTLRHPFRLLQLPLLFALLLASLALLGSQLTLLGLLGV